MRVIVTLLMVLGLSSLAWADYDEGIEYEVLTKIQPAPTDGKVEVIEFFSYGCPHCYRFEPYIDKWKETKSDNVEFINVPAIFNKNWEALATLYYAAEVLGVEDKMHIAIFEAMHGDGKKVRSFEDLKLVFEKNGVSGEDLEKALSSFTVAAKTRRAKAMTEAYGIKSVPNIVVQGKYRTNGTLAQSHANVFKVVDFLSEKIEKEAKQ
ncbi:MAG: thiol:disulfide interchange protein DsbA/DsbL [gamma proteobacterium symbiont of Lucinoma myriamae]|nr:thiol:disulfide interchange protein DsbA/DsbL [gamma proteobacterium symbiont of Lucinoma myriamae]MCU7818546.1 thiol:disulfide interchange protein DsbA/DsbL [gamma proteobacterium symbiont of Lucinoma myriamae]MCU7832316.1 thiol:disulfide interchange protein DsbA/DsbL [gamma proteobacterium symbiont of Lucinoma myriamae]